MKSQKAVFYKLFSKRYTFLIIMSLLSHSSIFTQNYTIKNDTLGYFILCKDNVEISKILNSPGKAAQYIVADEKNVCLLIEIQGGLITEYLNLKYIDNFWTITDSEVRWMQDQRWPYKTLSFKLLGEDKVEQFENGVSVGLVDFEKIRVENLKQKRDKEEFIKEYKKNKK